MINLNAGRVSALFLSALLGAGCGGEEAVEEPQNADGSTTFKVRLENVARFNQLKSGVYNTRVGGTAPGPLAPGEAYEFSFTAGRGQKLSFASMLGQSNDWIFATPPGGIELYENGYPISKDVTSSISLWDVGTEADEEPGVGAHTGPNQASSIDGPGAPDSDPSVRRVMPLTRLANGTSFNVPPVASMIKVSVHSDVLSRRFTVRIENVANDSSTLQTSRGARPVRISPGVWALATSGEPLFTEGKADRGLGLEAIAESGAVTQLASELTSGTGAATPLSPGVFVVHRAAGPMYRLGEADRGMGLERIAEEGNPATLAQALSEFLPVGTKSGTFTAPDGDYGTMPLTPGLAYSFEVKAFPGDRLSLVTMYGMSNDWFFGTAPEGIALFDAAGMPLTGDATAMIHLYDLGSELSEEPGVGANIAPQQPAPNTGAADTDNKVREVSSSVYGTPVPRHLKLTISR
ncbi:spondin domain-containing protein [Hyalangium gracile]|uniref:spondin domain-containing protein n=1 Tax=Hyalangium gracile TaxID=394092 RepID=UPI001CCF387F|nr:spondin domain-containing protein [Hyalangium gracile]